jgi:nucleoside-diphosphate-sugar epimerase
MILLTGGTGLVGSQLLLDLAISGKKIRALRRAVSDMSVVRKVFAAFPEKLNCIEWVEGDVNDIFSLEDALKDVHTVYHSAAFVSFYPSDKSKMMKVNIEGTANIVNAAMRMGVKRFCHVSSTAALGRVTGDQQLNEDSWWKPSKENSNYAVSKYGAEREVWRAMEEGLDAFIINPSIVLGRGNWKSGSSQMFSQVWKGLPFYVTGTTGFVDVRDVSKAAILLMEKGVRNERYILNSENLPYRIVFDLIADELSKKRAGIRVTPLLAEIGWRLEKIKSVFTNKRTMITRESARSGLMQWSYANEKIKKEIGIDFIPLKESVSFVCKAFLSDIQNANQK